MNILQQHGVHVKSCLSDQHGRTSLAFFNVKCNGNLGQLDDTSNNNSPAGITEASLSKFSTEVKNPKVGNVWTACWVFMSLSCLRIPWQADRLCFLMQQEYVVSYAVNIHNVVLVADLPLASLFLFSSWRPPWGTELGLLPADSQGQRDNWCHPATTSGIVS